MNDIQSMGYSPEDENKIRQLAAQLDAAGMGTDYSTARAIAKAIQLSEAIEITGNRLALLSRRFDTFKQQAANTLPIKSLSV